jgi:hypothetical protein
LKRAYTCQKYYEVNQCSIHNKHNISNNNMVTMTWYSMSSYIKLTPLKCHKLTLKCPMDRQMSHNRTQANWVPLIYLSSCFIFHLFSSSFQRAIWTIMKQTWKHSSNNFLVCGNDFWMTLRDGLLVVNWDNFGALWN